MHRQISNSYANIPEPVRKAFRDKAFRFFSDGYLNYCEKEQRYHTGHKYDKNKTDVFYILSTTLISDKDRDGKQVFGSTLSAEDKQIMSGEYEYISSKIFDADNFNFIAPYYRQLTFEAYGQTEKRKIITAAATARTDVCSAFDYYMEHVNSDRPYIIAGFSQGGLMTLELLKHMTDEQYSRMIAAYSMGFQVTERDLKVNNIKAAEGEDDLGAVISYNSVASTDTMWDQIEGKAAVCINPLNWKTDETPAKLTYNGDIAAVHVDKKHNVLVVEGLDPDKYDGMGYPIPRGVYHMWDIRFYADMIRQNAIHRAKLFSTRNK